MRAPCGWLGTAEIASETLIFLDETSIQTVMTRARGRAPRGERMVGAVPRNHGPNVTCLVAISAHGLHAPCVFEGALDGALFVQWIRTWLVPTLRPGMTVVLDTLSVHKNAGARAAIEAAGCQLRFLPAYSPDFNPIELAFAKLKTYLRGGRHEASRHWPRPSVTAWKLSRAQTSPGTIATGAIPCPDYLYENRSRALFHRPDPRGDPLRQIVHLTRPAKL